MYIVSKHGDIPAHIDHEVQYNRTVGTLRMEGLLDEDLFDRKGRAQGGRYMGYLWLVLGFIGIDMVINWIWTVVTVSASVDRYAPFESILFYWSCYFLMMLYFGAIRSPDQDRLAWLYNLGTPVRGTLDVIRQEATAEGLYTFAFHFTLPSGQRYKGRTLVYTRDLSHRDRKLLDDGEDITVLYHPDCPALNTVLLENGRDKYNLRRNPIEALPPVPANDPTKAAVAQAS